MTRYVIRAIVKRRVSWFLLTSNTGEGNEYIGLDFGGGGYHTTDRIVRLGLVRHHASQGAGDVHNGAIAGSSEDEKVTGQNAAKNAFMGRAPMPSLLNCIKLEIYKKIV